MGRRHIVASAIVVGMGWACGSTAGDSTFPPASSVDDGGGGGVGTGGGFVTDGAGPTTESGQGDVPMYAELWYCVDQLLVRIALGEADGAVANIAASTITTPLDVGQSAITMLKDGSLLVSRLSQSDDQSHLFHVPKPPRDGSSVTPNVTPVSLGVMPGGIMLEGLYTDCEGRVYGMDTGADDSSSTGNRLLRFTGDVTAGDFTFVVVSELGTADVADIDDMSPGIENNQVTDNPGLAIDTGAIHAFNYETGSGTQVASGGTFGIHALGGPLFRDGRSRLYVLKDNAELFQVDPVTFAVSQALGKGPTPAQGTAGWSSLAGPLTSCKTGFTAVPK